MTTEHPVTPPPELVEEWMAEIWHEGTPVRVAASDLHIATQAARWGADQELEACCEWIPKATPWDAEQLRVARRPKPPSLKELALETLRSMQIDPVILDGINVNKDVMDKYDILRRALESLPS